MIESQDKKKKYDHLNWNMRKTRVLLYGFRQTFANAGFKEQKEYKKYIDPMKDESKDEYPEDKTSKYLPITTMHLGNKISKFVLKHPNGEHTIVVEVEVLGQNQVVKSIRINDETYEVKNSD